MATNKSIYVHLLPFMLATFGAREINYTLNPALDFFTKYLELGYQTLRDVPMGLAVFLKIGKI